MAGTNSNDIIYSGYYDSQSDEPYSGIAITAFGGMSDETIFGSEDDGDALFGGDGNGYLYIVDVDGSIDELFGGLGLDVAAFGDIGSAEVTGLSTGIQVDLGAKDGISDDWENLPEGYQGAPCTVAKTNDADQTAVAWLYDIEGIDGTDHADDLIGDADANIMYGNCGADYIWTKQGEDTVTGGAGNDTLLGGNGDDSVFGGIDDDLIYGCRDMDWLDGERGNDVIHGDHGNDTIFGGEGSDAIYGGSQADNISGGQGSDHIWGGTGNDTLSGNTGADTFYFNSASGHDSVVAFAEEGQLVFEDLTQAQYDALITSLNGSATKLSFGSNSVELDADLNSANILSQSKDSQNLWDVTLSGEAASCGGGDTVICTYMNQREYISDEVYAWDEVYGARLGQEVLAGYHFWAVPLVEKVLKRSEVAKQIVRPLGCSWAQEMAHRCDPVAHPRGSILGRFLLAVGVPLCGVVGRLLTPLSKPEITA